MTNGEGTIVSLNSETEVVVQHFGLYDVYINFNRFSELIVMRDM